MFTWTRKFLLCRKKMFFRWENAGKPNLMLILTQTQFIVTSNSRWQNIIYMKSPLTCRYQFHVTQTYVFSSFYIISRSKSTFQRRERKLMKVGARKVCEILNSFQLTSHFSYFCVLKKLASIQPLNGWNIETFWVFFMIQI